MAVLVTPISSKVRLRFHTGVDEEGKPVYKNKTLSRVKTDAPDQAVFDAANALAALCADTLNAVTRIDDSDLSEEG
ncbi:MAG: DUF1659 domain-containing protein [Bacillota bacterium]|jgi:hypothetical protein|nr:DUF1659 domain-containing protein [Clostridia bacterium]